MRLGAVLVLISVIAASLWGCGGRPAYQEVDLDRGEPVPTGAWPAQGDGQPRLRLAMASLLAPAEMARSYGPFYAYLEAKLGITVELTQQGTYAETYDLLKTGSVDVALICTYVYILGRKQVALELLVAPEVGGRAEYHSEIIVREDSGITTVEQLAGRSFAFTDPLSTSGRSYPLALVRSMGTDPGTFFSRTIFTHSHGRSILAVAEGLVDGAAVDSLVLDSWRRANPQLTDRIAVINRSPAFASPPIVASPKLEPQMRERLRNILVAMDQDSEGRKVLATLGIDRFVRISDDAFDSVRQTAEQAGMAP